MEQTADVMQKQNVRSAWLKRGRTNESLLAYLFILPSLIGFITFYAVPAVRGLMISFTNWDLLGESQFIGFANYQQLIQDDQFWQSLQVTLYYVLLNIPLQTALAVGLAVLMDRLTQSLFVRGVLILPWLIPNVVVALLWLWMLDPSLGLINQILGVFGIPRQPFLGSVEQSMPAIAGINIWRHVGYTALLIFAGLQTIPKDVYEAAAIDGATERRMFWSITIPLLRPVLVFVLVTTIIGSFQIFDTIAITTQGGPVDATRVIYWYMYEQAFNRFNMGYATTVAVALLTILIIITIIQLRYLRADTSDLA
ncbi:MAG: ABC transporter permease subunit [Chloroflexi bacterium AL-W]|nr:ABC transporter permease subunit [Chloroflexi bacterium AL-N1]NOK65345.1 ABC transporter permease subunit [Chloroflexi bacterium AL-N10]NOK72390.1 ABC transporter permease subunit [Chloroflexi bacterium AL-N5]NOK79524.1 ABC transporter permease subunit [Chloroflexi bacterium AL-W]NOK87440.1 ABC transporter permease subunit [Chloroflexi bacterium AL-N15]